MRRAETVLLPDRACLDFSSDMDAVLSDTGLSRWVSLPLHVSGRVLGSLTVGWHAGRPFSPRELALLNAFADHCAQTLDRIQSHDQQRRTLEALQRNLLTEPPQTPGLAVAVRYHPAAQHEQLGEWYDALPASDGALTLVIGDITGHDRKALAAMAQIRNTLRGVAYTLGAPPAAILAGLEATLSALKVDVLASAALAHIWRPGQSGGDRTGTACCGATPATNPRC